MKEQILKQLAELIEKRVDDELRKRFSMLENEIYHMFSNYGFSDNDMISIGGQEHRVHLVKSHIKAEFTRVLKNRIVAEVCQEVLSESTLKNKD